MEGDNWEWFDSLMSGAGFLEQGWGTVGESQPGDGRWIWAIYTMTPTTTFPLHFPSSSLLGMKIKHKKGN